jgi:dynein heavy chain, axonemal
VISTNTVDVEAKQQAAKEKEEQLLIDSEKIAEEKADAEAALEEAIPALEEAAAALNDLKRDDITEIRSFAKPHINVQKVGLSALPGASLHSSPPSPHALSHTTEV